MSVLRLLHLSKLRIHLPNNPGTVILKVSEGYPSVKGLRLQIINHPIEDIKRGFERVVLIIR